MTATIHPLYEPDRPGLSHEVVTTGLKYRYLKHDVRTAMERIQEHALRAGDMEYARMANDVLELIARRYGR